MKKNNYSCIECGAKNVALFQVFSENALTLQTCANCSKVIDKYVEYDFTVIFIDILLLKFSAYRHVLYNSNTKTQLSRLLALTLLSSSYVEWVYQKAQIQQRSEFILYELEWSFYIMIGQELIKAALFSFTFMLLGFISSKMSVYRETFSWTHMFCGMAMSYCCTFVGYSRQCSEWEWFELPSRNPVYKHLVTVPSLVWNHYSTYRLLSQIALLISCNHTFHVCVCRSYVLSAITVLGAWGVQQIITPWLQH